MYQLCWLASSWHGYVSNHKTRSAHMFTASNGVEKRPWQWDRISLLCRKGPFFGYALFLPPVRGLWKPLHFEFILFYFYFYSSSQSQAHVYFIISFPLRNNWNTQVWESYIFFSVWRHSSSSLTLVGIGSIILSLESMGNIILSLVMQYGLTLSFKVILTGFPFFKCLKKLSNILSINMKKILQAQSSHTQKINQSCYCSKKFTWKWIIIHLWEGRHEQFAPKITTKLFCSQFFFSQNYG